MTGLLRLAERATKSPSLNFQVGSIILMVFQSFVAPFIIGVASFGAQMLFLAPVFLAQALLEPSYQAELNAAATTGKCRVNISSVCLQSAVLMAFAVVVTIGEYEIGVLILIAVFNTVFTMVLAAAFALNDVRSAALARYASLAAYLLVFGFMVIGGFDGEILVANLAGYVVASVIVGAVLLKSGRIHFYAGRPNFKTLVGGLSYRLPTICFTALTTIILGYAGAAASVIGEFRIFMAAISAGRFFNAVPLARLQAAIQQDVSTEAHSISRLLQRYIGSYAAYAAALSLLFPAAYDFAFGSPSFGYLHLLTASTLILAQPLAYFVFAARPHSWLTTLAFPVTLSIAAMLIFYLATIWSGSPIFAVSASISTSITVYLLVALQTGRAAKRHGVQSPTASQYVAASRRPRQIDSPSLDDGVASRPRHWQQPER